ncbi:XRE family transcriptional regulator [Nocardioides sp.]|uniref:XRE family transcriptional regulator n=1 Tax=Nocardioides sp. TaxID=35761 RepID=UPI002BF0A847|nr:XRE family transcriptional regulator [Nocardioides sp.]HXH78308.1 XRE family transcriptional regulator [Nocardioides sp.]
MSGSPTTFAETLRLAIEDRGLGLDRIRDHLEQRGVSVSIATLSYWRSGRSEPGRKTSMAAIPHLEEVLELDPGTLLQTLPLNRDRSRRTAVCGLDELWPESPQTDILGRLDTRWDAELDRVTLHDILRIGADRRQVSLTVRQVMRARSDGPDRRVVLHTQDDTTVELPSLRILRGCKLGRVEGSRPDGVIGAELLFPQPLRRGDTVIVEYEVVAAEPGALESEYLRRLPSPLREYFLEVEFDRAAVPASVVALIEESARRVDLDRTHRGHLVQTDAAPGTTGIRWSWPEDEQRLS